jgi:hypothetical protein
LEVAYGQCIWKIETNGPIFSTPTPIESLSKPMFAIGCHDRHLYLISSKGEVEAIVDFDAPVYSSPCVSGNGIVAVDIEGNMKVLSLTELNPTTVKTLQTIKLGCSTFASPLLISRSFVLQPSRNDALEMIPIQY